MAGEETVIAADEADRGHGPQDPALLARAAADLAVEAALQTVPGEGDQATRSDFNFDFPYIQADHTMGNNHPYYPFTHRII